MISVNMSLIDNASDMKKFERLYNDTKLRAYRTAYKILHNEAMAEDAVSEAYFKIAKCFQKIYKLEPHKLASYVVITVRNTALNMLKKERRIETVEYNDEVDLSPHIDNVAAERLAELIAELSDTDKEIIYLRYTLGLGYDEISAALGISPEAARRRMSYAKRSLKKLLEREGRL